MPLSVEVSTNVMDTDNYTTPEPTTTPTTTVTPTCCMTTPPSAPTTTTPTSVSPSQIMCPGGWEAFQGRCYYFANEVMTWPQAQVNNEQDCRFLQIKFSYFNYNVKYVIA